MNILITGAWRGAQDGCKTIRELGHTPFFLQNEKDMLPVSPEEIQGVICNGLFLYHPVEEFPSLRYIQLTSAGFDRVPMDDIQEKGIRIFNAAGVYSIPMAETALCGVLQLYRHSRFFMENQNVRRWEKHRGLLELAGKTVCIIGCGSVGVACAERFRAFGCRIIGVNRSCREHPAFAEMLSLEKLDDILAEADIVVLTVALTEQTKGLLNGNRLKKMKQGALLVNIARGALTDTEAVVNLLESGHLGGAVLDVFEEEPLDDHSPLWDMPNVILTPHNSFVGDGTEARLYRVIINNLEQFG